MLTLEKLNIFEEFDGDIDGWTRMRHDADNSLMTAAEWSQIDRLVMDLRIVASGRASVEFREETERMLRENAADEATLDAVRGLAARLARKPAS